MLAYLSRLSLPMHSKALSLAVRSYLCRWSLCDFRHVQCGASSFHYTCGRRKALHSLVGYNQEHCNIFHRYILLELLQLPILKCSLLENVWRESGQHIIRIQLIIVSLSQVWMEGLRWAVLCDFLSYDESFVTIHMRCLRFSSEIF